MFSKESTHSKVETKGSRLDIKGVLPGLSVVTQSGENIVTQTGGLSVVT
jgi:hypothetical protein